MPTMKPPTPRERSYTTVTGLVLTFTPTPEAAAFLARLEALAADPQTTSRDLIALGYSRENPTLETPPAGVLADLGHITARVLASPEYRVLADLIARRELAESGQTPEALALGYTITVTEAATQLGVSRPAVLKAIDEGRLSAWRKADGLYYVHPASLAAFPRARRGPAPSDDRSRPLRVRVGRDPKSAMKFKRAGDLTDLKRTGNVHEGTLPGGWRRVGVLATTGREAVRFYVLVPGAESQRIERGAFFIDGAFRIEREVEGAEALEAFDGFEAE